MERLAQFSALLASLTPFPPGIMVKLKLDATVSIIFKKEVVHAHAKR
jgi:hypothetical protein